MVSKILDIAVRISNTVNDHTGFRKLVRKIQIAEYGKTKPFHTQVAAAAGLATCLLDAARKSSKSANCMQVSTRFGTRVEVLQDVLASGTALQKSVLENDYPRETEFPVQQI